MSEFKLGQEVFVLAHGWGASDYRIAKTKVNAIIRKEFADGSTVLSYEFGGGGENFWDVRTESQIKDTVFATHTAATEELEKIRANQRNEELAMLKARLAELEGQSA